MAAVRKPTTKETGAPKSVKKPARKAVLKSVNSDSPTSWADAHKMMGDLIKENSKALKKLASL